MKRKVLVGFVAMVSILIMTVTTAFASVVDFPNETGSFYGETDGIVIKLQDAGVDAATAATITKVTVTFDQATDLMKPQVVVNSEKGGWNQVDLEYATVGQNVYERDVTGLYTADSGWNELWIKPGYKNEGAASLVSVVFSDADGNVVYSLGGAETEEAATTEDAAVTDDAAATTEDAAATDTAAETAVPKTGVVGFGLVYGLGALATGAVALKRKQK